MGFTAGAAVTVGAVIATIALYGDPYRGSLFWPHVLACRGGAGAAVALLAAVLAIRREASA